MTARLRLQSGLDRPGITVTSFLEHLVGEAVCTIDRRHVTVAASSGNELGVTVGEHLLQRSAVLGGTRSQQPYLYAETLLAPSRLPAAFTQELTGGSEPIGRLLAANGIRFSRAALPVGRNPGSLFQPGSTPKKHIWARRYRVTVDGAPVMVIAEWFLPSLRPFLRRTHRQRSSECASRRRG